MPNLTFPMSPTLFKVMWPEKEIYCKFCGTVYEVSHNCEEKEAANKTCPPNVDRAFVVSRKDEINQVDSEFKEPGRDAPDSVDPLNQPSIHPSTDTQEKKCIIRPIFTLK